ncbi:hypothetical protein BGW41_000021 [Actinomortierella wolfii]|nr:hypothetical protein BGW41_000021 [Actinomortierella wolfii]
MSLVSKPAPAKNNRRLGAIVAYTTLACSLISVGVYVYRQQKKQRSANGGRDQASAPGQPDSTRSNDAVGGSAESSLSKLGSRIARTVKRNRKVMTISIKNTIVWNPSPDPTTPNYGFVEGVVPLLFHLAENYNLHLILLCPSTATTQQQQSSSSSLSSSSRSQSTGKARRLTIDEEEALSNKEQLGRELEKEQILTMLANVGLVSTNAAAATDAAAAAAAGPDSSNKARTKFLNNGLIDPRRFLICETEEGISHIVRHLESQIHIDASREVVELVQGVVPRVVYVDRRPSAAALAAAAAAAAQQRQTANGRRVSSSTTSSSSSTSRVEEDIMTRSNMEGSFVQVSHNSGPSTASTLLSSSIASTSTAAASQKEPLVSGYVTQAGKKGYVEVIDSLLKSTLNPDTTRRS